MSIDTLYNLNIDSPTQITDEQYTNVGSDNFQLGTVKRGFYDVEIWDGLDPSAVQLVVDVDYTLEEIDADYTTLAGVNIYTAIDIVTAAYQTGSIYITYKTIGSYTDATIFNDSISAINNVKTDSLVVTADYSITDATTYNTFLVNSTAGDVTITLPTVADNTDRVIKVKVTHAGGKVTIDGEGVEEIDGDTSIYLLGQYDHVEIIGGASEWHILKMLSTYDTGWISRSDWTAVHMGSTTINYDGLSGTFTVGETITEATSSNTGIIQSDTGSVLVVKNVTGTGVFINDREITGGTSAATADVDGNTKNSDADVFHQIATNLSGLMCETLVSTDGTDDNSFVLFHGDISTNRGITYLQTDNNNIKVQSGSSGFNFIQDSGGSLTIDTEDWYGKIIVRRLV